MGRILLAAAGITMAALLAVFVPLTIASRDLHQSADATSAVLALALAAVGVVVARRQRRNPVGWLLLGSGLAVMVTTNAELYVVLDYGLHHGTLPLGPAAAFWESGLWALSFLIGTPALILFPDGDLPGRLWRWSMRVYLAASGIWLAGQVVGAVAAVAGQPIHLDASGAVTNNPSGLAGTVFGLSWIFAIPIPLIWLSWVGRQVVSYRHSGEQRREQLKWLTGGATLLVVGLVISLLATSSDSAGAQAAAIVSKLALVAFPVSMGVAILRYRLYEIDRIVSRTVAYAIVTGLLVGVYAGLVTLAAQVHPFSGAIGVAASTLAVAALFNPLRRRIQHLVDRRFNRARYDAEQTVVAFAARLKEAADLDSVRDDLAGVVYRTLEPAHVSFWVSPPGS